MNFYRLSEARVLRVLNSPNRIEEGVAPKTIAMMQPASLQTIRKKAVFGGVPHVDAEGSRRIPLNISMSKFGIKTASDQTWTQEIWVMVEDSRDYRTIISAWRYPGKTKPRSETSLAKMREEYQSFKEERSKKSEK